MTNFLNGAIMMGFAISGLFFFRFWSKTRDRFFSIFAIAFFMLASERWFLLMIEVGSEARSWVYLIRLAAFLLLIGGIVDKNRAT